MTSAPAVTFNPTTWKQRYPEFAGVSDGLAQMYFEEATLYCHNRLGPVRTVGTLTLLLNMVTAHVAALYSATTAAGESPSTPPGRIASASEGSVSASFALDLPAQAAYFSQTKYGLSYWQATAPYRTMNYRPGIAPVFGRGPWTYPN